ncbi:MAG TPA: NADH-quinone oxidoreductase subunit NuoH [Sunxiuqinia sp.]|nr:NADH-quinone oxidoreductase subunit NuoH [Sunxiuqinia sp.]
MNETLKLILTILGILIGVLSGAAGLIWLERRMLGLWQDRLGPNRLGPLGIFQPLADMIKIFAKEDWIPPFSSQRIFVIAPAISMFTILLAFIVIPITATTYVADMNIGILFFQAMISLEAYGVVLAGWASNNKYSLIGAMRGASQMITYEVFMGLSLMGVVMMSNSFNLIKIVEAQQGMWYIIPQFPAFIIFFTAGVAVTHRLPFDIPESESELVAGYHSEYSGMKFGMFFVGEYVGIILISAMIVSLFFGGWLGPHFLPPIAWFLLKTFVFIMIFILLRASLPRPRYDQLLGYGWKLLLPIALLNLLITGAILLS